MLPLELRDPTLHRRRSCAKRRRHGKGRSGRWSSTLQRDRKLQVIEGWSARRWAERQPFFSHAAEQRAAAHAARRELGKKVYARLCSTPY